MSEAVIAALSMEEIEIQVQARTVNLEGVIEQLKKESDERCALKEAPLRNLQDGSRWAKLNRWHCPLTFQQHADRR